MQRGQSFPKGPSFSQRPILAQKRPSYTPRPPPKQPWELRPDPWDDEDPDAPPDLEAQQVISAHTSPVVTPDE